MAHVPLVVRCALGDSWDVNVVCSPCDGVCKVAGIRLVWAPFPHPSASPHCRTPLPHPTATPHCHTPLPHPTATPHCHTPLLQLRCMWSGLSVVGVVGGRGCWWSGLLVAGVVGGRGCWWSGLLVVGVVGGQCDGWWASDSETAPASILYLAAGAETQQTQSHAWSLYFATGGSNSTQ